MSECELNFTEICRCCKRFEPGMASIFDESAEVDEPTNRTHPRLDEMLMTIAALNIQRTDGLPALICTACTHKTQAAYAFRQQVIDTEAELCNILEHQKKQLPQTNDISTFLKSLLDKSESEQKTDYFCDKCDKSYSTVRNLQTHVKSQHDIATIHECKKCKHMISNKANLKEHLYLHLKPFVCEKCKLAFNCMEELHEHSCSSTHSNTNNLDELTCDDVAENFIDHHIDIDEEIDADENIKDICVQKRKKYACKLCALNFARVYHIKRHLRTHLKHKNLFSCEKCKHTFSRKDKMLRHEKNCSGEVRLACDVCNRGFNSAEKLDFHKQQHSKVNNSQGQAKTLSEGDLEGEGFRKFYCYNEEKEEEGEVGGDLSDNDINNENGIEVEVDPANIISTLRREKVKTKKIYCCKLCEFTCKRFTHTKRHLYTHLKNKPFECHKCKFKFARGDKLTRHLKVCDGSTKYACDVCNMGFKSEDKLAEHVSLHLSEESAPITKSLELDDLDDDNIHDHYTVVAQAQPNLTLSSDDDNDNDIAYDVIIDEDVDDSDVDYTPEVKNKKITKRTKKSGRPGRPPKKSSNKKTKVDDVQGQPQGQFVCPVCNDSFDRVTLLESHGKDCHADYQVLKCGQCDASFSRVYALNRHMQFHKTVGDEQPEKRELPKKVKRHECDKCLKRFTTLQSKVFHMKKHNGGENFVCPKCSKPFLSKSNLAEHLKFHDKTRKFLCSECGQSFIRNDYLIIHMRRHRGEKPYACRFCEKGFPRATDLKVHERYHTGEKTHLCVVCGRGFSRAYNLTVHMRTHTGEKPYKCHYCDSAFAQCNDLKSHIRRHTGERFQCDLCPLNFIMGYELIQHKRKAHGLNVVSNIRRIYNSESTNPDEPPPKTMKLPQPMIPRSAVLADLSTNENPLVVKVDNDKEEPDIVYGT